MDDHMITCRNPPCKKAPKGRSPYCGQRCKMECHNARARASGRGLARTRREALVNLMETEGFCWWGGTKDAAKFFEAWEAATTIPRDRRRRDVMT